jgi:hypothetical protein
VADRWGWFCSQTMPIMVDRSQARSTWCVSEPSLAFADGAASALSTVNTVQPRGSRCEDGKTNVGLTETKQRQHARARIQLWFAQRDAYSIDQKAIAHFFVKRPECPWVSLYNVIVMPYVDGRVPSAIEEIGLGVGQPCLDSAMHPSKSINQHAPNPHAPNY